MTFLFDHEKKCFADHGPADAFVFQSEFQRKQSESQFFATLHCLLPVNGGARENWPRAGLEAFAAGVPVVAQNDWGWKEMIDHGVTDFLGDCDEELAHYAATLVAKPHEHGKLWLTN